MYMNSCSLCAAHYALTAEAHEAFCPSCVIKIKVDANSAIRYQNAINSGDYSVVPKSDEDRKRVRAAIARTLNPGTKDSIHWRATS